MQLVKKTTLFIVVFFLIWRFCNYETKGFTLQRIQSNLGYHPEWAVEGEIPPQIFNHSYHFLGSGAQTFAFSSEDGSTVIKFFRHHRTRHPLSPISSLLPKVWKNRLDQTMEKRKAKQCRDFSSYLLAFEELKEETGLLYLHLNKTTKLKTTLTLYDPIGICHHLHLDDYEFLVQKRALPLYQALEEWIEKKEFTLAKEALSHLVALLKHRIDKGIFDKDPDLKTNFGVIGTTVIQYDVGRFQKKADADPEILVRITDKLTKWLEGPAPELAIHLRTQVRQQKIDTL